MATARLKLEDWKDTRVSDENRKCLFPVIKLEVLDATKHAKRAINVTLPLNCEKPIGRRGRNDKII